MNIPDVSVVSYRLSGINPDRLPPGYTWIEIREITIMADVFRRIQDFGGRHIFF